MALSPFIILQDTLYMNVLYYTVHQNIPIVLIGSAYRLHLLYSMIRKN